VQSACDELIDKGAIITGEKWAVYGTTQGLPRHDLWDEVAL